MLGLIVVVGIGARLLRKRTELRAKKVMIAELLAEHGSSFQFLHQTQETEPANEQECTSVGYNTIRTSNPRMVRESKL